MPPEKMLQGPGRARFPPGWEDIAVQTEHQQGKRETLSPLQHVELYRIKSFFCGWLWGKEASQRTAVNLTECSANRKL